MNATATTTRLLTSNKGTTIETNLSDIEALTIIQSLTYSNFAQDLYRKAQQYSLSESQLVWVHKLALEEVQKRTPKTQQTQPEASVSLLSVVQMFQNAGDRLKYPKIRLLDPNTNKQLKLYPASANSRHPGSIQIVDEASGDWYGRIELNGCFTKSRNCQNWVESLVNQFADKPETVAAEYGKLTGCCCFCLQSLTDSRSTQVGYGPVCAKNYRLPW